MSKNYDAAKGQVHETMMNIPSDTLDVGVVEQMYQVTVTLCAMNNSEAHIHICFEKGKYK